MPPTADTRATQEGEEEEYLLCSGLLYLLEVVMESIGEVMKSVGSRVWGNRGDGIKLVAVVLVATVAAAAVVVVLEKKRREDEWVRREAMDNNTKWDLFSSFSDSLLYLSHSLSEGLSEGLYAYLSKLFF